MDSVSDFLLNKQLNETEFKEGKVILQSKPRFLRLILTNQCNINCIMCGSSFSEKKFTIPYEVLEQIIELFPYLEFINWQGGEVFLVSYFKDLFKKALSFPNIRHEIQTNGLLLNREWAEFLTKHNIDLLFSIDGVAKDTYEYIRQRGSFEKLLENISLVNEFKQKYNSHSYMTLCACIMKSNYKQIEEFVDFAKRNNFQRIVFGLIHGGFAYQEDIFNPPDDEAIKYLKKVFAGVEKKCYENNIRMDYRFKPLLLNEGNDSLARQRQDCMTQLPKCRHPWAQLLIDGIRDGCVYPHCMCQNSIGNIMEENILDIWNGVHMQRYRQEILNRSFQSICSDLCVKKLVPEDYFV